MPFLREGVAAGAATLVRLTPRRERLVLDALGDAHGVTVLPFAALQAPVSALRDTYALVARAAATTSGAPVRLLGEVPPEPWSAWSRYVEPERFLAASAEREVDPLERSGPDDRVVVTVTDRGRGPADPLVGLATDLGQPVDEASSLHHVHDALDDVSVRTGGEGFTVRLVQRCPR